AQTNALGYTTAYDYNFAGRAVRSRWPDGSRREVSLIQTAALPDPASGLGTRDNPAPAVVNVRGVYKDANGNSVVIANERFRGPTSITNALGATTLNERDGNGNVTRVTLPNGVVIAVTYDPQGNMLSLTNRATNLTKRFTYDSRFSKPTSSTDPSGNTTTIVYDARGNPTAITDSLGNQTSLTYDTRGLPITVRDSQGNLTSFSYDTRGNVITLSDSLGQATRYEYDLSGNIIRIIDSEGRAKTLAYDPINRATSVADAAGNVTRTSYDAMGNQISVTDPRGNMTLFDYDSAGRLIQTTNPSGQITAYSYDANGNFIRSVDAEGQTIAFEYDAANQLVRKILPDEVVVYTYDSVGNVVRVANAGSTVAFNYDGANRLASVTTFGDDLPEMTLRYDYDANGNLIRRTDPQGRITNYAYDTLNRLTRLTDPRNQATAFAYNGNSQLSQVSFANGVATAYTYNPAGQLASVATRQGATAHLNFQYTYDRSGNIATKSELAGANVFTYDSLNRLINATHPQPFNPPENFTYDSVGNRVASHLAGSYLYDNANRLTQDSRFIYTYDGNGTLIAKEEIGTGLATVFTYNADNQLKRIDFPDGGFAEYRYDGLKRRILKNVNGVVTKYVYDNENILLELDAANTPKAMWMFGLITDKPISMERDGATLFYHTDELGSIRVLTNTAGAVAQSYSYDAFGNIVQQIGSVANPFTYTGREFDSESGLYYYRSRYYDPQIGRFISEDPVGFDGGINFYPYVENNPTNFVDPNGEFGQIIAGAAIGAGVDLAWQLITNGGRFDCVDWGRVAMAGAFGAVGGVATKVIGKVFAWGLNRWAPAAAEILKQGGGLTARVSLSLTRVGNTAAQAERNTFFLSGVKFTPYTPYSQINALAYIQPYGNMASVVREVQYRFVIGAIGPVANGTGTQFAPILGWRLRELGMFWRLVP
ncbi:MAG: RHS repeat protein, partial [Acidobacteria bacterium]|nr:RHS repeat protein [Acidobacteriota bacterium]